ncbi:MAG: hypothetical protein Q7S14_00010 [bacterium]|nr:hypothetical protein [bacterium]
MRRYKLLSIDETGKASYKHPSGLFVLSGAVIPEKLKSKIDHKMRLLKKKFFDDEEIVFHARDMVRKKGPFSILQNEKTELRFWSEFISLVNNPEISFFFIITNKLAAKEACWQLQTILRRSYLKILADFTRHLKISGYCGKIIVESDPDQDLYLIYAHNRMQAEGTGDGSVNGVEYRKMVTSLSLVNKSNQDIDVQLADAMALIASLKYELTVQKRRHQLTKIEAMKMRLLDRKLADKINPSLFEILI